MDNNSIPQKKQCSKCGQEYPATLEYWHKHRGGFSSRCKKCQREISKHNYAKNADKHRRASREYRLKNPERIRDYNRKYYDEHRDYFSAWHQRYYETNRDALIEKARLYAVQNRNFILIRRRRYYEENKERLRAECRAYYKRTIVDRHTYHQIYESTRRKVRKFDVVYRLQQQTAKHRRRAREMALPNTLTTKQWQDALDYFHGCCAVCGRLPDLWHTLAQDHWIPLSDTRKDNPGSAAGNIIPLCHSRKGAPDAGCNNMKWRKDPVEWLIQRYGEKKAQQILRRIFDYFEWVKQQNTD